MTRKLKKRLKRIIIGAAFFAAAVLIENFAPGLPWYVLLAVFLTAYVIVGGDVVKRAVGNIGKGQVFDENFLMTIATVGAYFVGEYPEAVAVMLLYQGGEPFQKEHNGADGYPSGFCQCAQGRRGRAGGPG